MRATTSKENEMLFDYAGRPIAVVDNSAVEAQIAEAMARLEELKKEDSAPPAKNHRPGNPTNAVWIRLGELSTSGKVPQQQKDLAKILSLHMEIGVEYKEVDVFAFVTDDAVQYASLAKSRQHPTYLLRFYRGLKARGSHAGFVARGFVRVR